MSIFLKSLDKAELELQQAQEDMAAAECLMESGFYKGVANRLYYSMFHGVSSLFSKDGIRLKSHAGSHNLFIREYSIKGIFPEEDAKIYSQLQTLRESSDYDAYYSVSEKDVKDKIPYVKGFIERITQYKGMFIEVVNTVVARANDSSAKSFTAEQYSLLNKFKESLDPSEKKEPYFDLWNIVLQEIKNKKLNIYPEWLEDTHQELMDFASGKVRDSSYSLKI